MLKRVVPNSEIQHWITQSMYAVQHTFISTYSPHES